MADVARQTITINATPTHCYDVVVDFERYPEWAKDVKEVTVLARDDAGRATEVEFRTSALGRSTHFAVHYDYSEAPGRLSWKLVRGDIMRAIDGQYTFTAVATGTQVEYEQAIELVVPLPGFVKRRAEVRILNAGVKELKARAEA